MSSYKEKAFPRGGKNPALSIKVKKPNGFSLFDKGSSKLEKKIKKKRQKNEFTDGTFKPKKRTKTKETSSDVEKFQQKKFVIEYVGDLNPTITHEGMFLLGIVSNVTDKFVNISLPGGMRGVVKLLNVSEFYKDLVIKSTGEEKVANLKNILKVGDILPTKVIAGSDTTNIRKFYLSLDPMLINSKLCEIETGMILVGSVKSKEEHGYIIDFGVTSIRGFLKFQKVKNKVKLPVGRLVRCCVIECINSQGILHVQLSILDGDMIACLPHDSMMPIHSYIPGMQFNLVVTKVMKDGVEVTYRNDPSFKGYVHEDYLPSLFPALDKINIGTQYIGILLFIKPLVNIPYFKVILDKPDDLTYPYGKIVKGKVVKTTRSGVFFRVGRKEMPTKCFVPIPNLVDSKKLIENDLSLDKLYPAKKVVEKIRLKKIDYMRRCYIGETNKSAVNEKYFSVTDIKCGEIIHCTIESLTEAHIILKKGNLLGIVPLNHVMDIPVRNLGAKFKVGQKVNARVLDVNVITRNIRMTMKPSLVDKDAKILMNYGDAKRGESYIGTLKEVSEKGLKVEFFNGVFGFIFKKYIPFASLQQLTENYAPGQLVKCYVLKAMGRKLLMSLTSKDQTKKFKIGKKYRAVVTKVLHDGLCVRVAADGEESEEGFIPMELMFDYPGVGRAMLETFSPNQKITAYHVHQTVGSVPIFATSKSVARFYEILKQEKNHPESFARVGKVHPFMFFRYNEKKQCFVLIPFVTCRGYKFYAEPANVFDRVDQDLFQRFPIQKYQIVYGKILGFDRTEVRVSLKLTDVWDKNYRTSLSLLSVYVDCMKRLISCHRQKNEKYLENVSLGSLISCSVEKGKSDVYEMDEVHPWMKGAEGVKGAVVWIRADVKKICVNPNAPEVAANQDEQGLADETYRAKIVYIGDEVVVAVLKGKGNGSLAFLPRKRHTNDFINSDCPYKVGYLTRVCVERSKSNISLAIDRQVTLLEERRMWKTFERTLETNTSTLKRKLPTERGDGKMRRLDEDDDMEIMSEKIRDRVEVKEEVADETGDDIQCEYVGGVPTSYVMDMEIKQEVDSDECVDLSVPSEMVNNDVDIKSEYDSDENRENGGEGIYSKERIPLSSSSELESDDDDAVEEKNDDLNVGFNWDVLTKRELLSGANLKPEEESSSDEEEENNNAKKKHARLSKAEREEKAKAEEERLRGIEERLMRTDVDPETADDFDRALLAKPNSSALWVKYMAFHLQATEIEKARAVARRGLKTISFTEEREKLNIWVALLNLENLYGNEESLNKTMGEALMCNEPYHIQLHMFNMHGQSSKFQEMERTGNLMMKKFKGVDNMWEDVGLGYFKVGKVESARRVLQRALDLLEKKRHVDLISRFAQMENKYGSSERAQTLYETILTSFPKRVDIWSCYVDMLVKSDMTNLARQVLERATSQSLPPKKMKIIFKKFLSFEEKHGTPENVEKVRQSAVNYVETVASMAEK